jgi:hypothetical protein
LGLAALDGILGPAGFDGESFSHSSAAASNQTFLVPRELATEARRRGEEEEKLLILDFIQYRPTKWADIG